RETDSGEDREKESSNKAFTRQRQSFNATVTEPPHMNTKRELSNRGDDDGASTRDGASTCTPISSGEVWR
ncbi:hypothetical protein HN873_001852, partial [Arachis hypogaea]